jgi:hypothetical protein
MGQISMENLSFPAQLSVEINSVIYYATTGALFYDSNGYAAGGTVQIATLSTGLALTNNDFLIV